MRFIKVPAVGFSVVGCGIFLSGCGHDTDPAATTKSSSSEIDAPTLVMLKKFEENTKSIMQDLEALSKQGGYEYCNYYEIDVMIGDKRRTLTTESLEGNTRIYADTTVRLYGISSPGADTPKSELLEFARHKAAIISFDIDDVFPKLVPVVGDLSPRCRTLSVVYDVSKVIAASQVSNGASNLPRFIQRMHSTGLTIGLGFITDPSGEPPIINFSTTLPYVDPETGKHIPEKEIGEVRPQPTWGVLGPWQLQGKMVEWSRRDDIYLFALILVLTTQSVADPKLSLDKGLTPMELEKVRTAFIDSILEAVPLPVRQFYEYSSSMGFYDKPDYDKWISAMEAAAAAESAKAIKKTNNRSSKDISPNNDQ